MNKPFSPWIISVSAIIIAVTAFFQETPIHAANGPLFNQISKLPYSLALVSGECAEVFGTNGVEVNVRSGPGSNYGIVATMSEQTVIKIKSG